MSNEIVLERARWRGGEARGSGGLLILTLERKVNSAGSEDEDHTYLNQNFEGLLFRSEW